MKFSITRSLSRNKGIALITVISVLAMLVILTVAILSLSQTERSSSEVFSQQEQSRELSDVAVNAVMGQVWQGTKRRAGASGPTTYIWASQPGAIRRYNLNGTFNAGFKLYSSSNMVANGAEGQMSTDVPPATWNTMSTRYVDLNEPVVRPDSSVDADNDPDLIFPIIDPRAYVAANDTNGVVGEANTNVEGFSYKTNIINGAVAAASSVDTQARLPMPVEWLYVLKDGTLGTLDAQNNLILATGASLGASGATNPIVGRIAFWADDESCKLNINTASEPTFWGLPSIYHERDMNWAYMQPSSYEYQRYPGHPATIALSTVIFPNQEMDMFGKSGAEQTRIRRQKESIYAIAPKINNGGSQVGTLPYWKLVDSEVGYKDASTFNKIVDLTESSKERLYATVDELLFSQRMNGPMRDVNRMVDTNGNPTSPLFTNPSDLERLRFFLTAQSRVPETNMYGTPRIAMWPVADESKGGTFRTGFDQLIAFCSSMGKSTSAGTDRTYFFRRKDALSPTADIEIARNKALLKYLNALMDKDMPGGSNFNAKYNQDAKQILVEIFDYIRATNLYDGFLSPTREDVRAKNGPYDIDAIPNGASENHKIGQIYRKMELDATVRQYKTFTPPRASDTNTQNYSGVSKTERIGRKSYPGHGQATPSYSQEWDALGFGRFLTVSEVGFHFICTADGNEDKGSYILPVADGGGWKKGTLKSGGRTALKLDVHTGDGSGTANYKTITDPYTSEKYPEVYYSNYPPRPGKTFFESIGLSMAAPLDSPLNPSNHPAGKPYNWNCTLDAGTALKPGERRVQGMLSLELSVPASGYTKLHPNFSIKITGLGDTQLDAKVLYPNAANVIWKSGFELFDSTHARGVGGCVNTFGMSQDRYTKSTHTGMNNDPGWDGAAANSGDPHRGLRNYELTTKFITVVGPTMRFTGAPLTLKIYAGHDTNDETKLIQTVNVKLPTLEIPTPELVTLSSDHEEWRDATTGNASQQAALEAPHWWAFNNGGAIGRFIGDYRNFEELLTPTPSIAGRLFRQASGFDRTSRGAVPRGQTFTWGFDSGMGDFNSSLINPASPAQDSPADAFGDTGITDTRPSSTGTPRDSRGCDVIFTMVPKHGDTRLLAAKRIVPQEDWMEHPKCAFLGQADSTQGRLNFAHNLSRYYSNPEAGYDRGVPATRLVKNAGYEGSRVPDLPSAAAPALEAQKYGDFDNAVGNLRDGAYINKPDEGNADLLFYPVNNVVERIANAYMGGEVEWVSAEPGESYMTPNRIIPSPGMLGSLPTGVKAGVPWKTLLFRAATRPDGATVSHPGSPSTLGGIDPADHYFMDLFWMPIVEPYAISEPFSTAGKVNINYQMVPFNSYIRRATGIHGVMKGELMEAIPLVDAGRYKRPPSKSDGSRFPQKKDNYTYYQLFSDDPATTANYAQARAGDTGSKNWHRAIEVEKRIGNNVFGVIRQIESRFNSTSSATTPAGTHGLFRTASQICEIHLIPRKVEGSIGTDGGDGDSSALRTPYVDSQMTNFWKERSLSGDNTRERPYANIYGKISTQSNTFRVHYRTQAIRKARSSAPGGFNPQLDSVLTDYRGSALIERRVDPSNSNIPDYGASSTPTTLRSLDEFYQFRVIETKRFVP